MQCVVVGAREAPVRGQRITPIRGTGYLFDVQAATICRSWKGFAVIYHNPPQSVLGRAEVVTFLDPNVPGWKEVVVRRAVGLKTDPANLAVINIPVDSTDQPALQAWRDRIAQARV
jgi:hypothetical protein